MVQDKVTHEMNKHNHAFEQNLCIGTNYVFSILLYRFNTYDHIDKQLMNWQIPVINPAAS